MSLVDIFELMSLAPDQPHLIDGHGRRRSQGEDPSTTVRISPLRSRSSLFLDPWKSSSVLSERRPRWRVDVRHSRRGWHPAGQDQRSSQPPRCPCRRSCPGTRHRSAWSFAVPGEETVQPSRVHPTPDEVRTPESPRRRLTAPRETGSTRGLARHVYGSTDYGGNPRPDPRRLSTSRRRWCGERQGRHDVMSARTAIWAAQRRETGDTAAETAPRTGGWRRWVWCVWAW